MMQSKGEITRKKILEAAAELFKTKGFGATSINNLLEATGLKKGSLYFHFPSKDAIALAILEQARTGFFVFLDAALSGTTPGAQLDNFLNKVLKIHKKTGFIGGCIFGNTALEMADSESDFAAFIEQVFEEWIKKLGMVITKAQVLGEVRNDLPADLLAGHMVAAIEGAIMLARLKKDEKPLSDALVAIRALLQR